MSRGPSPSKRPLPMMMGVNAEAQNAALQSLNKIGGAVPT